MSLTLDENHAAFQIRSYQPGQIQVNDQFYTNSIIIRPTQLIDHWSPNTLSELSAFHLNVILDLHPAVFILGTGTTLTFPPIEVYGNLINHGIGVEIMDTRAACRTYNALASEDRNVIAALIIN